MANVVVKNTFIDIKVVKNMFIDTKADGEDEDDVDKNPMPIMDRSQSDPTDGRTQRSQYLGKVSELGMLEADLKNEAIAEEESDDSEGGLARTKTYVKRAEAPVPEVPLAKMSPMNVILPIKIGDKQEGNDKDESNDDDVSNGSEGSPSLAYARTASANTTHPLLLLTTDLPEQKIVSATSPMFLNVPVTTVNAAAAPTAQPPGNVPFTPDLVSPSAAAGFDMSTAKLREYALLQQSRLQQATTMLNMQFWENKQRDAEIQRLMNMLQSQGGGCQLGLGFPSAPARGFGSAQQFYTGKKGKVRGKGR